jgi:hypothetical protein
LHGFADGDGGLTREPWNEEAAPKAPDSNPQDDLSVLDDDFGQATSNTDPLARSAATRAYGVEQADGDDAFPAF